MADNNKDETLFTDSIIGNFLILFIPPLLGILGYLIAKNLWGDLLFGGFPVIVGLLALLLCFPLTWAAVKVISHQFK